LVPKTLALNNPNTIALAVAPYIYYFSLAFYPFVWLLSASTNIISSIIGVKKSTDLITEAELRQMIKLASSTGVIEKEQNVMHEKVFYFADKKAKHIMTHRMEVEWLNAKLDNESIHEKLLHTTHSKIIFCNENLEDIIGVLLVHDYFKTCNSGNQFNFKDLLIEPTYVPESISAQSVLSIFQQGKIHLCCVVNEYGGFEGVITIHDILENFVGQIPEDGQVFEPDIFVRDDNTILVNGDAPIEILSEVIPSFRINFEEIDYSTIAGFVVDNLRKIPQLGDKIVLHDFTIEVIDLDGNKIDKVLITKHK
jgi:putative hemolysin